MKKNESTLDRLIRSGFGLVLIVLFALQIVNGPLAIIGLVLGIILVVTGAVGFCPLYTLLKIRTNK